MHNQIGGSWEGTRRAVGGGEVGNGGSFVSVFWADEDEKPSVFHKRHYARKRGEARWPTMGI